MPEQRSHLQRAAGYTGPINVNVEIKEEAQQRDVYLPMIYLFLFLAAVFLIVGFVIYPETALVHVLLAGLMFALSVLYWYLRSREDSSDQS